ncbi:MAG: hypothetical protein ACXVHX_29860 [Solirubrobacteraceae bacterium]
MRVLDLGTGLGHVALQVAGLLDPEGSVLGASSARCRRLPRSMHEPRGAGDAHGAVEMDDPE